MIEGLRVYGQPFFLAVFVVILVMIPFGIIQARKTSSAWETAAKRLGLQFDPGGFLTKRSISGRTKRGFLIEVRTVTRGGGKNSRTDTRIRVSLPRSLGLGLRLAAEGFFSGVSKLFGAQDITVGDAAFDNSVVVKGGNPRGVMEFLSPARRARIARFLRSYGGSVIDDCSIEWTRTGVMRNAEEIVGCVRSFVGLGVHLIDDRDEDRSMERAMKAQHDGKLDEAYAIVKERRKAARKTRSSLRQSDEATRRVRRSRKTKRRLQKASRPKQPPPPPTVTPKTPPQETPEPPETTVVPEAVGESAAAADEALLEGELLYLAGRKEEAKAAFEDAAEEAPGDPEIRGWAKHLKDERPQA